MKNIKLFEQFIGESNQPINENEDFGYTPAAAKIAKVLMKKHETLEMNAENFDKIQAALKPVFVNYNSHLYKIANASKYADWVQENVQGHKFLFDKKGKLKFIIDEFTNKGKNMTYFTYIADKDKGQELEDWAYENYPRLFQNMDWVVYQHSERDCYPWKMPTEGTFEFVSAPTEKIAMQNTKANPSKDDSFWENHGIKKVSKQEINQLKKEIKQKADHYTELVKQLASYR